MFQFYLYYYLVGPFLVPEVQNCPSLLIKVQFYNCVWQDHEASMVKYFPLSHYQILRKKSWLGTQEIYLEIPESFRVVSGKSPASWTEIAKSGNSLEIVSGILCVTARIWEIVSGICQYGLIFFCLKLNLLLCGLWKQIGTVTDNEGQTVKIVLSRDIT